MSLFVNKLYQCPRQVLEKQDWSEMAGTVSFLELKFKSFIMRILSCECTKISRGDTNVGGVHALLGPTVTTCRMNSMQM